jgi:amino acid transporter
LRDLVLFNIAAVVGIRWLAAAAHAGPGSFTLWLLAAVFFFVPIGLSVAALSFRFPEQGGIYVWTQKGFGDWHGFLCGWCYWLSNIFYFPNLVLAGVGMAGTALGLAENRNVIIVLSLAIVWIALIANIFGLAVGKWIGNLGGIATYVAGALLIVVGILVWTRHGSATTLQILPKWDLDKLNFWSQIAFAFGGLELGAIMAGEIRDPARTIRRAAWISGISICAFYMLGTLALLVLLPPDQINIMTGLVQAGTTAGARLGVSWLAPAIAVLISLGVLGQLGAWIAGSARIPFVIGIDRHMPAAFGRLHPRWRTPHVSILTAGVTCTVFLLIMQAGENLRIAYQLLVDITVITYFIPFAYLFAASWKFGQRWIAAAGMAVTIMALAFTLVPPSDVRSVWLFELKLVGGFAVVALIGRICYTTSASEKRPAV